ncbi:MAG: hypothetical protein ACOH1Y_12635 [Propionicimonas sp.]
MPTTAPSHLAVRQRTALVESVLGHPVDWSGLPDPSGYIAEVLGRTYERPTAPDLGPVELLGRNANYYQHAEQSPASVLDLVKSHSSGGRVVDPMIAWTGSRAGTGIDRAREVAPIVYRVWGWTSTAILRATLSRQLDSLNPVAGFLLLEKPEIAVLDRSHSDYVVLRPMLDRREAGSGLFAGAIRSADIDFWQNTEADEVERSFALDIDAYHARFLGTGVAA